MSAGLANVAALGYLLTVPALILIYYFSRKSRRVEVSSIIPWRLLKNSIVRSSLFRADFLFYLQLLLLLILVLCACRPYWGRSGCEEEGRHVVMVMDRSASMQTMEGRSSRWEIACARALRLLRRLGDGDRVTLIAAGAAPAVLAAGEGNLTRLEQVILGLDAADTPDSLVPAIELALSLTGRGGDDDPGDVVAAPTYLYIFTDRSGESLGADGLPGSCEVHVERVGSPKGNAAITAFEVCRNLFLPRRESAAYVTVGNFSREVFTGRLTIRSGGRDFDSKEIRLEPESSLTTGLGDGQRLPNGELEVVLDPRDSLPVDNRAYAVAEGSMKTRVVLFTRTGSGAAQLRAVAEATDLLELDVRRADGPAMSDVDSYSAAIFYRCEPESDPDTNMLLICPPVKSRFVNVREAWVSDSRFLDWDEKHPVGRNLRGLNSITLSGCRIFDTPPWARPVVLSATTSGDVPLVFCGEHRGRRIAVTSFDMSGIALEDSGSVPAIILLLNLLSWLCDDGGSQIRTGDVYETLVGQDRGGNEATVCTLVDPRGRKDRVVAGLSGCLAVNGTEYAGRYRVIWNGAERTFVANLFDREESDLYLDGSEGEVPPMQGAIPAARAPVEAAGPRPPDRTGLFLTACLAMLMAEWLIYVARPRRRAMEPAG